MILYYHLSIITKITFKKISFFLLFVVGQCEVIASSDDLLYVILVFCIDPTPLQNTADPVARQGHAWCRTRQIVEPAGGRDTSSQT